MGEEEEVGHKFGLVLGAKVQGKPLKPPMDKQRLQTFSQEAKGVPGFFRALKLYAKTGENKKHILWLVFMTFMNTVIGLSSFWK